MSKHLTALQKQLGGTAIHASAEAMGMAVAIAGNELVTAKAKLFGVQVRRFPMQSLGGVRTIPNPSANVLVVEFTTTPPQNLTIMYGREASHDFDTIIATLRTRLGADHAE